MAFAGGNAEGSKTGRSLNRQMAVKSVQRFDPKVLSAIFDSPALAIGNDRSRIVQLESFRRLNP